MVLDSAVQNGSAVYDKWFSGSLTPAFKHKWYFKNLRHLDPVCGGMDLSFVYDDKKSVKVQFCRLENPKRKIVRKGSVVSDRNYLRAEGNIGECARSTSIENNQRGTLFEPTYECIIWA